MNDCYWNDALAGPLLYPIGLQLMLQGDLNLANDYIIRVTTCSPHGKPFWPLYHMVFPTKASFSEQVVSWYLDHNRLAHLELQEAKQ